jgi:hypothetical protein
MSKLSSKLNEEFFKLLPPRIFFFVALHLVMFIRVLMLEGTGFYMTQEQTEITETAKGPLRFLR